MVVEIAQIEVIPGQEDAFATAYQKAQRFLLESPGCRGARMARGVESPSRFVSIVEWQSVEHRLTNFRRTQRYERYRDLLAPYLARPPVVEHFTDLAVRSF